VCISKEQGFVDAAQNVEVERVVTTLVLRWVAQETIGDLTKTLIAFSTI